MKASHWRPRWFLIAEAVLFVGVASVAGSVFADEAPSPDAAVSPASDDQPAAGSTAESPAERERKESLRRELRRAFTVLLLLVLLAVFVSVLFLVWGIRVRRRIRQPLPPIHKGDELWFLKPATPKPDDNQPDTPPESPPPPNPLAG